MTEYSNSACLLALRHKTFMKNVNSAHVSVTFCELVKKQTFAVWWKFSLTCDSSQCDVRSRENSMLVSPRDPHPPPERNSQSYGSWECIHCKCLRPENEIVWGTVDEASKWRPECIHCRASTPLPPVSSRQQTPPRTGTPLSATMPRTGSPLGGAARHASRPSRRCHQTAPRPGRSHRRCAPLAVQAASAASAT